jgi:hypothetical protein
MTEREKAELMGQITNLKRRISALEAAEEERCRKDKLQLFGTAWTDFEIAEATGRQWK